MRLSQKLFNLVDGQIRPTHLADMVAVIMQVPRLPVIDKHHALRNAVENLPLY